jgi:hypothetical protein
VGDSRQAGGHGVRYAHAMVRSPNATPTGFLTPDRMKWLWLVVAGALGLWLVILLVVSDEDEQPSGQGVGQAVPNQGAPKQQPAPKQYERASAFSKRPELRSSRPSPTIPLRVDQGQGK